METINDLCRRMIDEKYAAQVEASQEKYELRRQIIDLKAELAKERAERAYWERRAKGAVA